MTEPRKSNLESRNSKQAGFSIIELLVSVAIITLLMAAFFQFVSATQRQHRGNQLLAEIYQGGRSALEAITQETQQAGYNPDFGYTTTTAVIAPLATAQFVNVASSFGMFPGNDVIIDPGAGQEKVRIAAVSTAPDKFSAIFSAPHASGATVVSAAQPFPTGIMTTTDGMIFQFYGSQLKKDKIQYIEYSCYPKGANRSVGCPATGTTTIGGTTYNLYILYRSATDVPFAAGALANDGSPVVDNVVSTAVGANAAGGSGPSGTGPPVFHFDTALVGTTTVVTRVTITLTLQTLVRDPDSGQLRTATLRSQIVPRNIVDAVSAYAASGNDASLLPATPPGLPMTP